MKAWTSKRSGACGRGQEAGDPCEWDNEDLTWSAAGWQEEGCLPGQFSCCELGSWDMV